MSPHGAPDPLYVRARSVLFDGLDALIEHADSVILVGEQAVYLHAGEADFAVAPHTTDGDLAIDARTLSSYPLLEVAMVSRGFARDQQPGSWVSRDDIAIDLLIPESIAGAGTRRVTIPPHSRYSARRVRRLEGALTDNTIAIIRSLDPNDSRERAVRVAGPAALIVAKLVKIGERVADPRRLRDKDAFDVLRLLRAIETDTLAASLVRLSQDALAAETTREAIRILESSCGSMDADGPRMVRGHVGPVDETPFASELVVRLARRLLRRLGRIADK